jgi:hypothetical protein
LRSFRDSVGKILIKPGGTGGGFGGRGGHVPLLQPLTNALSQTPEAERHDRLERAHAFAAFHEPQVPDQAPRTTAHARKANAARKLYEHRMTMHPFAIPSILDVRPNLLAKKRRQDSWPAQRECPSDERRIAFLIFGLADSWNPTK